MRFVRTLALTLPLVFAATACKKSAPPETAPAAKEEPAAPPMSWKWGPASFSGSRAEGNTGTLKVPVKVTNNTDTGLVLKAVRLGVMGGGSEACSAKVGSPGKAASGATLEFMLEIADCSYGSFPEEGKLMGKATVVYTLGGDDNEDMVDVKIGFQR